MRFRVFELRQYATRPRRRDDLIALFDEHFIEGQEQHGMRIIGQFRDRNDPDRFVWMRDFPGMEERRKALEGFYGGPIWKEHRTAANDTMVDVSNVLLLRPVGSDLRLPAERPGLNAPETPGGVVTATICCFRLPADDELVRFFDDDVAPVLRAAGAAVLGSFVTEPSENTFPRLPVRQGENVLVWLASFADGAAVAAHRAALEGDRAWRDSVLNARLAKPAETLELMPTRRSLLRHPVPLGAGR